MMLLELEPLGFVIENRLPLLMHYASASFSEIFSDTGFRQLSQMLLSIIFFHTYIGIHSSHCHSSIMKRNSKLTFDQQALRFSNARGSTRIPNRDYPLPGAETTRVDQQLWTHNDHRWGNHQENSDNNSRKIVHTPHKDQPRGASQACDSRCV